MKSVPEESVNKGRKLIVASCLFILCGPSLIPGLRWAVTGVTVCMAVGFSLGGEVPPVFLGCRIVCVVDDAPEGVFHAWVHPDAVLLFQLYNEVFPFFILDVFERMITKIFNHIMRHIRSDRRNSLENGHAD